MEKLPELNRESSLKDVQAYLTKLMKHPMQYHIDDHPNDICWATGAQEAIDLVTKNHEIMWAICTKHRVDPWDLLEVW